MAFTEWRAFNAAEISKVAALGGVYRLAHGKEITYIGKADKSVKDRLNDHLAGREGSGTQSANWFCYEVCFFPGNREKDLLQAFNLLNGKLPRCNARIG